MSKTTFDRNTVKNLRTEIQTALDTVAKKHGIRLSMGSIRFSPDKFTTRLTAESDAKPAESPYSEKAFAALAGTFYLKPEDFGRMVTVGGRMYTLAGFRPNSLKYPVVARYRTGKMYKLSAVDVLRALGRSAEAKRYEETYAYDPELLAERRAEAAFERRFRNRHED